VTYTVNWTANALQELASVWMAASNRNAVTHTANDIDDILEVFPYTVGESTFDIVREYTRPPLGVEYEVNDAIRRVVVLSVWSTDTGRPSPTGN